MPDGHPLPVWRLIAARPYTPTLCKRDTTPCHCCQRTVDAGETIWQSPWPGDDQVNLCYHCAVACHLAYPPIGPISPDDVQPYGGGPHPAA